MFYKKTSIFRSSHSRKFFKRCVLKIFCNIHRKTPVLESVFNKVAELQVCNFIKETPTQMLSCKYCEIFKNTPLEKHLQTAVAYETFIITSKVTRKVNSFQKKYLSTTKYLDHKFSGNQNQLKMHLTFIILNYHI